MKTRVLLLFLLGSLIVAAAEEFVKIQKTFGGFYDIVVNSKGRWYIVHSGELCTSTDKGVTRERIELPSRQTVRTGLGIDKSDNIYVQDGKLTVFRVIRSESGEFTFEELTLPYANEQLVSRPFSLRDNKVYFASKSGLMSLNHRDKSAEEVNAPPYGKSEITKMVHYEYTTSYHYYKEGIYYSGGGNRQWIYRKYSREKPIWQTAASVKQMNAVYDRIFYAVNDVNNEIYMIQEGDKDVLIPVALEGINASNINSENDFVIHSPKHGNKTYLYMHVDGKATIYGLDDKKVDGHSVVEIVSKHQLDNKFLSFKCAVFDDDKIYFGTESGVYELKDIQPKSILE